MYKNKKIYFFIFFIQVLTVCLKADTIPYDITVNGSIKNEIFENNPTILWKCDSSINSYNIQISNNSSFSSIFLDEIINQIFYEPSLYRNDTYYIRIRSLFNGSWSDWTDSASENFFILNLNFKDIQLDFERVVFKDETEVSWLFNKSYSEQLQKFYEFSIKKMGSDTWTNSLRVETNVQSGKVKFNEVGIYNIKLILYDQYDNKTEFISDKTIEYSKNDLVAPKINQLYFSSFIRKSNNYFWFNH